MTLTGPTNMTKEEREELKAKEIQDALERLGELAEQSGDNGVWPDFRILFAELSRLDEAAKYHGVARFVDAEEIAELMEAGARTWMPMEMAKPVRNGSIIVMTTDNVPVIGQAFWHEHGDGTWALHWQSVDPKVDCWNDPITETNKGLACWQPMPEGPCEARVKAIGSPGPHMAALLRIKALEEACQEAVDLLLERIHHNPARSAAHNARLTLQAALSPSKSEADNEG